MGPLWSASRAFQEGAVMHLSAARQSTCRGREAAAGPTSAHNKINMYNVPNHWAYYLNLKCIYLNTRKMNFTIVQNMHGIKKKTFSEENISFQMKQTQIHGLCCKKTCLEARWCAFWPLHLLSPIKIRLFFYCLVWNYCLWNKNTRLSQHYLSKISGRRLVYYSKKLEWPKIMSPKRNK